MSFDIGYSLFNTLEAIFWAVIGLILFIRISYIPVPFKKNTLWGGIFFLLFGISDIAEIMIGGIFEPHQYWLLAIKVVCVIAFVVLFVRYVKIRKEVGI